MTPSRLASLIDQFASRRIAVLGDYFLDKYLDVDPTLEEPSLETGKPAHQVVRVRHSPGAAGTVVNNLAALGTGRIIAIGVVGDDGEGFELRRDLEERNCDTRHLHADSRLMTPTYLKPRDASDASLAGEHSRYDTKNHRQLLVDLERRVIDSLRTVVEDVDAVIILDQVEAEGTGVVTPGVRGALASLAPCFDNVVFWADSRAFIHQFRNVVIKANEFEVSGAETDENAVSIELLSSNLTKTRRRNSAPVVVTLGERGILVSDPTPTHVPTVAVEAPVDPTGAGDSATAGAVLARTSGAEWPEAALVANLVGSITVKQLATTGTASPEQLPDQLSKWLDQNHEEDQQ